MKYMIATILMAFGMNAYAADGSSGCGLGWEVLPKNSLVSSYSRTITNAVTSSTLGMTSGTSGCAKHSIVENSKKDIHYAESNFHELMMEMSQGQGEHLKGFALAMGCTGAEVGAFSKATQSNYGEIFSNSKVQPADLVRNTRSTMETAKICSNNQI